MANITPDSQLEFELGEGETETSIELPETESPDDDNSSTLEASASAPAAKPEPEKHELDQVSENVQKRIAKLTAKMREAERREQAALDYARNVQAKAQELEQKLEVLNILRDYAMSKVFQIILLRWVEMHHCYQK